MWIPALLTSLLLGANAPLQGQSMASMLREPSPEERLMSRIEALVVMPTGTSPLHEYTRSYAWAPGKTKVTAIFFRDGLNKRKWVPEGELPQIFDGGCSVVTVVFDVGLDKIERVGCNGVA